MARFYLDDEAIEDEDHNAHHSDGYSEEDLCAEDQNETTSVVEWKAEQQESNEEEEDDDNDQTMMRPSSEDTMNNGMTMNPYYVPYPRRKEKGFVARYWLSILSIVVLLISYFTCYSFPLVPPHHRDVDDPSSWSLFLHNHTEHFLHSSKALFIDTPYHIGSSWFYHTWVYLQLLTVTDSSTASSPCVWKEKIPHSLQQDLLKSIQGQSQAVELVADAVHAWSRKQALFVMAVGHPSTGKRSLALALESLLRDPTSCSTATVLHIQQWQCCATRQEYFTVLRRVDHHLHLHPAGAMIVWTLVDPSSTPDYVARLLQELVTRPNVLVYMTTTAQEGLTVLAKHLRAHTHGSSAVVADLEYAFTSSTLPASSTVMLPFWPHTAATLFEILHAQHCQDAQIQDILHAIDYLEWRTSAGELVLKMAVDGAKALPWNKLGAQRALEATKKKGAEETTVKSGA